jgi:gliding motility-associated lipoprotein GldD
MILKYNRLSLLLWLLLPACNNEVQTPKPYAYHRIDLPEAAYQPFDQACPFVFEQSIHSQISRPRNAENDCWLNIEYPALQATIHLSYKVIDANRPVGRYIQDAQRMTFKHTVKASSIDEIPVAFSEKRVYGLLYRVGGNAASNSQFYLTDSTRHFVRGALYFMAEPRADSLAPVVNYLLNDMERLISTFGWK